MTEVPDRLRSALADRYTIERELGSGGMATVYLAEDLKHHRTVAVKVLRPELATALGVDRFHQEIKIAANLNHPRGQRVGWGFGPFRFTVANRVSSRPSMILT